MLRFVVWLVLAGDSTRIQRMIFRDVSRASAESFFRSIGDLWRTDLSSRVGEIRVPTLGVFGAQDNIVNPNQAEILATGVPQSYIEMMPYSRHFPMLDEPEPFRETLLSFLSNGRHEAIQRQQPALQDLTDQPRPNAGPDRVNYR
jgi:pimeloyl-ACP methyl ester carboxylesterase